MSWWITSLRLGKHHVTADHLSHVASGEAASGIDDGFPDSTLFKVDTTAEWYGDLLYLLSTGLFPKDASLVQKRRLLIKSKPFTLIGGRLYRAILDGVLRRCVSPHEVTHILEDAHSGPTGGHYPGHVTAHKVLQSGLWWPYVFRDAIAHVKVYDVCQRCAHKPSKQANRPLHVSLAWLPFDKRGLDFIGPISPLAQPRN
ncbi:hypothetical protein L7F22_037484 [Adiantum nelumboides]|nr:hypothetical protein [Adiantum nelumboides]